MATQKEKAKTSKKGTITSKPVQQAMNKPKRKKAATHANTPGKITQEDEIRALRKEIIALNAKRNIGNANEKSAQQTIPIVNDFKGGVFELMNLNPLKSLKKKEEIGNAYSMSFQFEDMNYHSLSPEEAEVKFCQWKDFINSFTHDCELSMTVINRNQDIEALKKDIQYRDRGDGFDELRHEWNEMMNNKVLEGNSYLSKNRYFTLKINAETPLKASTSLNKLENTILSAFQKIGAPAKRMGTLERYQLLHDILRPENVGEFDITRFDYKQLKKEMRDIKDFICPDAFDFKPEGDKTGKTFMIGDKYARCYFINDYPAVLSDKLLTEMTDQEFTVMATVSIKPESQDAAINLIRKKRLSVNSMVMKAQKDAMKQGYSPDLINFDLKNDKDNADTLLDEVTNKNQKLFYVTFTVMHMANTLEELEMDAKTLQSISNRFLCQLRTAQMQQERAFYQVLPLGYNLIKARRTCTSEMTCAFMPFLAQDVFHKNGLYYGLNKISNNLIYINRFSLLNANGFILGTSGSGKSFSAKREMAGMLLNTDTEVLVIDPDGEYAPFCEEMGGELIEISPTSPNHINPMEMDKDYGLDEKGNRTDPVIKKADFILSLCEEIIGDDVVGIDPVQKAFIDRCIKIVYQTYIESGYDRQFLPTLKDLQEVFNENYDSPNEEAIAKAFTLFTTGSLNVFSHETNINTHTRFTVYDISKLGDTMSSMGQLIMLDAVWNKVLENRKKGITTCLYSDEFTVLLRRSKSKVFFLDVFKRIRKLGGSATGITQNITSLLRDPDATEMLSNSEFVYLLNQSASDRIQLQKLFELSDVQLSYISDVERGNGLIKAGHNVLPFKDDFPKDTRLYNAMTTDAKERKAIEAGQKLD